MKLILLILFLAPITLKATPKIYFDYKIYYTPEHQPYVETLLQFSAPSLKFIANEKGDLVATLEITQIYRKGDSIIFADKYIVQSPPMPDSTIEDFYDIKRFALQPNSYDFEIIIKDLNTEKTVSGMQQINIPSFDENELVFSSLEFIETARRTTEKNEFVKNGYFMIPYLTNYFPPQNDKIATYFEIYNTDKIIGPQQKFILTYEVEDYLYGEKMDDIFKVQKFTTSGIIPVISLVSIANLPSGDYNFVISLYDSTNTILKQEKIFFQRRNNITSPNTISIENVDLAMSFTKDVYKDSIPFYLNSLLPISLTYDRDNILTLLKTNDTVAMQKYFHAYWVQTQPTNPYEAWLKYKEQVLYVEDQFATQIKHGFETDRGRVYLKYGAPDFVMDRPSEPSAYPYQIWKYYKIGTFSDIRFIFYDPDLVTNDYPLLHSEMRGELQNYRWEHDLHKRDSPFQDIDDPNDGNKDHYGGQSGVYFRNQ